MKQVLKLPFRLESYNNYINMNRRNVYLANNYKKDVQMDIIAYIKKCKLQKFTKPVKLNILWIEKTKKRDVDNVQSGQKFILDALVQAKILENDSPKYVTQINHKIDYDGIDGDKIIVEIEEI